MKIAISKAFISPDLSRRDAFGAGGVENRTNFRATFKFLSSNKSPWCERMMRIDRLTCRFVLKQNRIFIEQAQSTRPCLNLDHGLANASLWGKPVASGNSCLRWILLTQVIITTICFQSLAQQDPVYAQYPNNPFVLNPAYTGLNNRFNANVQYRSQWSAVEGHPETFNFNTHTSILDNKAGVGLIVVQDKIGENTTTEFSATGSYKIKLQRDRAFSFGMQAGMMRFTNNNSNLNLQPGDPYFATYNVSHFNTGAGAMLKSDRFMVGISVPRLLPVTVNQGAGQNILVYDRTYYLFGSYQIFLNERVRLRPAMLLHTSDKFKGSVDLNMNLQIEDFYSAGVFTRSFNTYGLLLQMIVKHYRFGYAIEVPGSKTAIPFTTHEFMLGISLRALRYHEDSFSVF